MFIFGGTHVEQQLLLWRFIHRLPNHTKLSRITSSKPCKRAASITESLLRTGGCWLGIFLHGLQCWATPFTMHFGFRPSQNFRGTFAKIPLSADPSHQRRIRGKANTRGLGVWLSQSLTFGSLAAAFGTCFLRLQKATLGSTRSSCKDVLEASPSVATNLRITYERKGKCAVPFSCRIPGRQEVVALNKL